MSKTFFLRRAHKDTEKLIWHEYKTEEARDWWAQKYKADGHTVWVGEQHELYWLKDEDAI